jgi:hypothetical protein
LRVPDTLLDAVKEEQNRARDVGRSSRGTHIGKVSHHHHIRKGLILPFFLQAVDLLEVRSLLKLASVLSVHVIYPQAVADEAILCMVEGDEAEEVEFTCRCDVR